MNNVNTDVHRSSLSEAQEEAVGEVLRGLEEVRERTVRKPSVYGVTMAELHTDPALVADWEGLAYQRERNVISIFGGRGVGKTTVLEEVLRRVLTEHSSTTIVLDPIIPESFLAGDHPIGWIAASLGPHVQIVEEELLNQGLESAAHGVRESYRKFNQRVHMYMVAEGWEGASQYDTAARVIDLQITASTAGYQLPASFVEVVDTLLDAHMQLNPEGKVDAECRTLMIVPFDDVDLHPQEVRRILSSIPIIVAHPSVAVLFTADPQLLHSEMVRTYRGFVEEEDEIRVLQLAQDHLRKRLPADLRVSLPSFSPTERLNFVPQGSTQRLIDVLRSVETQRSRLGPQNLADFFDLSWNFQPGQAPAEVFLTTQYADMLPDDPRSLTQLDSIVGSHSAILRRIAQAEPRFWEVDTYKARFFDFIREFLLFLKDKYVEGSDTFDETFVFDSFDSTVRFLRPKDMKVGGAVRPMRSFFENGDNVVQLGELLVFDGDRRFSSSVAGYFNFALEMDFLPMNIHWVGRPLVPPGSINDNTIFQVGQLRLGWPLPELESMLIHMARSTRWRLPTNEAGRSLAGRDKLEGEAATSCRLRLLYWYVCSVIEASVLHASSIRYEIEEGEIRSDELWELLTQRVVEVLTLITDLAREGNRFARAMVFDYDRWIVRDLAWMSFDEVAQDSEVQERVRSLRAEVCSAMTYDASMVEGGESDAAGYLVEARREFPAARIEELDLQRVVPAVVEGDKGAVARVMFALSTDRTPSNKRSQLEALMRSLGYEVPELTEAQRAERLGLSEEQALD